MPGQDIRWGGGYLFKCDMFFRGSSAIPLQIWGNCTENVQGITDKLSVAKEIVHYFLVNDFNQALGCDADCILLFLDDSV